jgi:hypothetical protein
MLPLAHLGHWYVSLPVFGGPVLALGGAVAVSAWRDRRRTGGRVRPRVETDHDRRVIKVIGPLDHPALIDIELDLEAMTASTAPVVLDLRRVTAVEANSPRRLAAIVDETTRGAQIALPREPPPLVEALKAASAAGNIEVLDHALAEAVGGDHSLSRRRPPKPGTWAPP